MSGGTVAAIATLSTGLVSSLAALIKIMLDRRLGISGDERQARQEAREDRRDTVADRDALIDQLQEQIGSARIQMAAVAERADRLLAELEVERLYSRTLVDHIYRSLPPPPPPRPTLS